MESTIGMLRLMMSDIMKQETTSQLYSKILEFGRPIQQIMKQFQQMSGISNSKQNKMVLMIGMLSMVKTVGKIVEAKEDNATGVDQPVIAVTLQNMI